jgi:hypothetical protein
LIGIADQDVWLGDVGMDCLIALKNVAEKNAREHGDLQGMT